MRQKTMHGGSGTANGSDLYQLRKSQDNGTMVFQQAIDSSSTPKTTSTTSNPAMYKQSSTLSESSNRSFLKHLTQAESYSGRALISYLTGGSIGSNSNNTANSNNHSTSNDKLSNQLSFTNRSHRDSVGSIKSITSEDVLNNTQSTNGGDANRGKIILDETVNPKRPLRPSRLQQQQQQTNSGFNSPNSHSNQNSRPISHLSGIATDNTNFNSITNLLNIQDIHIGDDDDLLIGNSQCEINSGDQQQQQLLFAPPPKPPKLIKIKSTPVTSPTRNGGANGGRHHHNGSFNGQDTPNDNGLSGMGHVSFSSENLLLMKPAAATETGAKSHDIIISAQSSASLNSMQFRFLTKKTASADTGINQVHF
jgi:hypothetical protein